MTPGEALDVLWGTLTSEQVVALQGDEPEVYEACRRNHERVSHASENALPQEDYGPDAVTVTIGAILAPLTTNPGVDVGTYAKQMTAYLAKNLERFSDDRGGDTFLAVIVKRGEDTGNHSYRSGHFVKDEDEEQNDDSTDTADDTDDAATDVESG